ncbi:hypothetical protein GCM10009850_044590 [Nonomuraea monospora]|uniref:Protein kinase domain-containing protein n=1 Tax=Nonomuraea monospora TaxID=568818 RepID=A0ABN3CJB9_9ACTN
MAGRRPLGPQDLARVGGHQLTHILGEGGQGIVYLGRSPDGRPVAVKVLHARRATDPAESRRFTRESAIIARLAPFCTAAVLETGELDGRPYLISEYVPGPTLDELVGESGPLRTGLDQLAVATLTALSAVHRAGIVHRDFKPSNVIMGPVGPTVIDFGIARLTDRSTTRSGLVGTPAYLAPELLDGQRAGPAADVFAWAATMVFAATGHRAFPGETQAAVLFALLTSEPDLTGVPPRLAPLLKACFAKKPQDRPTTEALLDHLTSRVRPAPPAVVPPPVPETSETASPQRRPVNRRALLAAAAATGAAGAASLLIPPWLASRPSTTGPSTQITTAPATTAPATTAPATTAPATTAARPSPVSSPRATTFITDFPVRSLTLGRLGDLTIAVTGGDDNTVRLWNLRTHQQHGETMQGTRQSPGSTGEFVQSVAMGQLDGEPIICGSSGLDDLVVWDPRTYRRSGATIRLKPQGSYRFRVKVAQVSGRTIALSHSSGPSIDVWDLGTRKRHGAPLTGLPGQVAVMEVGQLDGRVVIAGGDDEGGLLMWDLESGQPRGDLLKGHTEQLSAIAFGQIDGTAVALSGGLDETVRVWDLETGKLRGNLMSRLGVVEWIGTGQLDGQPIAVVINAGNVMRLWNLRSGEQHGKTLRDRLTVFQQAAIGRLDGRTIVVVTADSERGENGATRLWDLGPA